MGCTVSCGVTLTQDVLQHRNKRLHPHQEACPDPPSFAQVNANPNAGPEIARITYNAVLWALNGGSLSTNDKDSYK